MVNNKFPEANCFINHFSISGEQVTAQWYSEIDRYDFKNHKGNSAGSYTYLDLIFNTSFNIYL